MLNSSIRLDKWLWYARKVKTRSKASKLVKDGKIRVNRDRISKASYLIQPGDVITATIGSRVHILEVVAPGTRRGPAIEAATLYNDLTPERPETRLVSSARSLVPQREKGSGRPTKRERRQTDRLRQSVIYDRTGKED